MTEYTVHFRKGSCVGTRSLRMVTVEADRIRTAAILAKQQFPDWKEQGYRLTRVDHIDADGHVIIDW